MSKESVFEAVRTANELRVAPARIGGCARIYVTLGGKPSKDLVKHIEASCKRLNLIFQRKAYYGLTNAIYIGYDNADGRALAKGEAFAAELTRRGIQAYVEGCAD
ncbi:MAG: hypothetical protein WBY94_19730 [Polyangiaceae bacterium]